MFKKKVRGKAMLLAILFSICLTLIGCGKDEAKEGGKAADTKEIAGDYYLDLSELGMKLTLYLRIEDDGKFQFSNTTDFKINKSSGTIEKSSDKYIMVYESVNEEEKTLAEGVTSSFTVRDDKSLDFSGCERIYYGSATAVTVSSEDPSITLSAIPIPEDYEEASTESEFTAGTYVATEGSDSFRLSCYDDNSYILVIIREENGAKIYSSESGIYGVSTTQLALTPTGQDRLSGEILSATELNVPVLLSGSEERTSIAFSKEEESSVISTLAGADTEVTLFSDGSYTSVSAGFSESGILVLDSAQGSFKIYPDHPETGVRGLNQINTVPAGTYTQSGSSMTLIDFRVRTSEGLSRTKVTVTQN